MNDLLTREQVANILQVDIRNIINWEKDFSAFFSARDKKTGRYNDYDLELMAQIRELLEVELYTIEGAKRRLELTKIANGALGIEQNFKTTVFFMFSTIMQELERAREESRYLADQLELLRKERGRMLDNLKKEQKKTLWRFIYDRLSG